MAALPDLSRFELACLRRMWARGESSVRDLHSDLPRGPSYSTVRKIVERLEQKGAVARVRQEGKAWVYRPTISRPAMLRKEVQRLLDSLFDGEAAPLLAHLADVKALSLDDLREAEQRLSGRKRR